MQLSNSPSGQTILLPVRAGTILTSCMVALLLDFLKPFLGLRTHLAHPSRGSGLQFGMIFVLPRSSRRAAYVVADELDFLVCYFSQKYLPPVPDINFHHIEKRL